MKIQLPHLTLVDDDSSFLYVLSMALEGSYKTTVFTVPGDALRFIKDCPTDGVLLDVHMKEFCGLKICREIKAVKAKLPVFFLSSDINTSLIDQGFESGGIDYFSKSMLLPEISKRIFKRLVQNKET